MGLENITEKKVEIIEKVFEADKKFIEMAVNAVIEYFEKIEEESEQCSSNRIVCPSMIAKGYVAMPFVNEIIIRRVLDLMYSRELLEREIPEGTGIPPLFLEMT